MPRATPMPPEERRAAIVDAVLPLVLERGEMPSTREVAGCAGIAEGTIFRVFDDKTALLHAVLERAMTMPGGDAEPPGAESGADLRTRVVATVGALQHRMRTVSRVMMAVRRDPEARGDGPRRGPGARPPGPPAFVVEANERLLAHLTAVLEADRDRLRVPPATAAAVLRGLVFGLEHPGLAEHVSLAPEEVADVLLRGVAAPAATPHPAVRPEETPC